MFKLSHMVNRRIMMFFIFYRTTEKLVVGKICYVFKRSLLCSLRLHLFDEKYSKVSNIVNN